MEEEKKEEVKEEEEKKEEAPEASPNMVDTARLLVKEIKDERIRLTEEREALQMAQAKEILGGRSEAGHIPEPPKEETPEEYAKKVMSGDLNG